MKKYVPILLLLIAVVLLTACGRGGDTERPDPDDILAHIRRGVAGEEPGDAPTSYTVQPPGLGPAAQRGGTLRVFAPTYAQFGFRGLLFIAAYEISRTMGVEVEWSYFNPETRAEHWAQNLPQAIVNGEFDIVFADPRFPMFDMARDGLFADIYELIDFCPRFSVHDFYFEALQTLTIGNNLYFFPLGFGFQYVSINANWVPERFVERFNSYETITVSQMMDIYLEIARNHTVYLDMEVDNLRLRSLHPRLDGVPGPISLSFSNCRDLTFPEFLVWNAIMDYVCLNTKTSNLTDPGFVAFLEKILAFFPLDEDGFADMSSYGRLRHNSVPRRSWICYIPRWPQTLHLPEWIQHDYFWESLEYMFMVHNEFLNPAAALTQFRPSSLCPVDMELNPVYTHSCQAFRRFIPLVDEAGRLRTNIGTTFPWKTVAIANGSNRDLAWTFVSQYLIPASLCAENNYFRATNRLINLGIHTFDSPIERSVAAAHFPNLFTVPMQKHAAELTAAQSEWLTSPPVRIHWAYDVETSEWFINFPHNESLEASPVEIERAIGRVVAQIEEMNEWQMAPVPLIPFELFELPLQSMLRRLISAETTAQIIHDNLVAWFATNH